MALRIIALMLALLAVGCGEARPGEVLGRASILAPHACELVVPPGALATAEAAADPWRSCVDIEIREAPTQRREAHAVVFLADDPGDASDEVDTLNGSIELYLDPIADSGRDPAAVLSHELGHHLGLNHDPDPSSFMAIPTRIDRPTPRDVDRLCALAQGEVLR